VDDKVKKFRSETTFWAGQSAFEPCIVEWGGDWIRLSEIELRWREGASASRSVTLLITSARTGSTLYSKAFTTDTGSGWRSTLWRPALAGMPVLDKAFFMRFTFAAPTTGKAMEVQDVLVRGLKVDQQLGEELAS
jgi:hypothetical protein